MTAANSDYKPHLFFTNRRTIMHPSIHEKNPSQLLRFSKKRSHVVCSWRSFHVNMIHTSQPNAAVRVKPFPRLPQCGYIHSWTLVLKRYCKMRPNLSIECIYIDVVTEIFKIWRYFLITPLELISVMLLAIMGAGLIWRSLPKVLKIYDQGIISWCPKQHKSRTLIHKTNFKAR